MTFRSNRDQLKRLREAKGRRPRKIGDPRDPWEQAHRIRDFLLAEIADGNIEPYEVSPVEEIHAYFSTSRRKRLMSSNKLGPPGELPPNWARLVEDATTDGASIWRP